MTTREFIAKTINTSSDKLRTCSSVFTDYNGVVYSYGYHYPLAVIIDGVGYVNNRGYSNTTAKHINWAFSALRDQGYTALGVPLLPVNSPLGRREFDKHSIEISASAELARLIELAASKKRQDTWVYKDIQRQIENIKEVLATV